MSSRYQKATGSCGSKGVDFQIDLLAVPLLNAIRQNIKDWKLSTENKLAGKFDDVVLELSDGSAILLQAKHKEKKKITLDQILSTNSKKEDFSLPKYFLSYLDIRTRIPVKLIFICTNTQVESKVIKFINQNSVSGENMLHYQDGTSFFTFNDGIVDDLIINAKVYYETNSKGKGIDETLITEENAREFLEHLELHLTYPSGNDLENIIEKLLEDLKHLGNLFRNISHRDLHHKIKNWFQQPKGEYLTENRLKAMLCEVKSEKCRDWLENYKVFFKSIDTKIADSNKRIFHVITDRGRLLHSMKVYRSLQQNKFKVLYASSEDGADVQKEVIKAFELPTYTHLVIISPTFTSNSIISEVCDVLTKILHNRDYKKIVFVANRDNKLVQQMKSANYTFDLFNESLTLADLSKDTQNILLKKKSIAFQGEDVSLEEVFSHQLTDIHQQSVTSDTVEKLVKDEKITVGKKLVDLEEDISRYYVGRKFERIIKDVDGVKRGKEIVSEEDIYNVQEKLILISDSAGTGKTTVLTNLALEIKQNNPQLWVTRIELNRCTKILQHSLKNKEKLNLWDLLKAKHTTKPTNELETLLFSLERKMVILLDSVDEISPDYSDLIFDLLVQVQKAKNVSKTFVTTRPHMVPELEAYSTATFFTLTPLTEPNQVYFFTNYWRQNLHLEFGTEDRCERYAKNLISKMFASMTSWHDGGEKEFIVTPLHARMLAEVFLENRGTEEWEGCKEYLSEDNEEPKLPERMNMAKLYGMFIEKKKDIFMEKENPSGNATANQALMDQFEECLAYHRSLALEVIFSEEDCELFTCYQNNLREMETKVLKMGIVQKLDNKLNFVHRTFAEYFVAESVIQQMQLQSMDVEFQKFLIDEVFVNVEYNVLRQFLDNFLQNITPPIPSGIFESYQTLVEGTRNYSLIHRLAREGNKEIIRLILKCIELTRQTISENSTIDLSFRPHSISGHFLQKNTLMILQELIGHDGINIRDDKDRTPLHWSVLGGHLDTAKFLLTLGADVNINSEFGGTILHLAVEENRRNIIEYLLEIGMNINVTDKQRRTALYYAVERDSCDIIQFLLERGLDIDLADYRGCTALHLAAQRGTLTTVEFLVELGMELDIIDQENRTALHYAAETGNYDIVKFLVGRGMAINLKDQQGCTALHLASKRGRKDIVAFLLAHGSEVNVIDKKGRSALHLAVLNGNSNTVEFLVEKSIDVDIEDEEGRTALQFAAELCRWDNVKFLVGLGMSVNLTDHKCRTILHYAVERGDCDIVDFLMRHGADATIADFQGYTPLYVAVSSRNLSIVEFLLTQGRDMDINRVHKDGLTVLHCAIKNRSLDTVKLLLGSGAKADIADLKGSTSLHLAASQRNGKIIEFLLDRGIDVNMVDNNGQTAIYYAIESLGSRVTKLLVEHGLDINIADNEGNTALHCAIERSHIVDDMEDIVECLLEHGADVNSANKKGELPIHSAAKRTSGSKQIMKLLIEHGSDINSTNHEGNTVLHLACQTKYHRTVKFLVKCGAGVNVINKEGKTALNLATEKEYVLNDIVRLLRRKVKDSKGIKTPVEDDN